MFSFIEKTNKALANSKDEDRVRAMFDYMNSLKIKRCLMMKSGKREFVANKRMYVRNFVYMGCKRLSACLMNEDLNNLDILEAIDNFDWKTPVASASKEKAKRKRDIDRTSFVSARGLGKRHDWKTIN